MLLSSQLITNRLGNPNGRALFRGQRDVGSVLGGPVDEPGPQFTSRHGGEQRRAMLLGVPQVCPQVRSVSTAPLAGCRLRSVSPSDPEMIHRNRRLWIRRALVVFMAQIAVGDPLRMGLPRRRSVA